MGLYKYDKFTYGPGIYYWRSFSMDKKHFIMVQISEYCNPRPDRSRLHVEMLLPASGSSYKYKYHGPIEKMPDGLFYGPIEKPK